MRGRNLEMNVQQPAVIGVDLLEKELLSPTALTLTLRVQFS